MRWINNIFWLDEVKPKKMRDRRDILGSVITNWQTSTKRRENRWSELADNHSMCSLALSYGLVAKANTE